MTAEQLQMALYWMADNMRIWVPSAIVALYLILDGSIRLLLVALDGSG